MAALIAAVYAVIGGLWILFSGLLVHTLAVDADAAARLENIKGWFFVGVTASLLWVALDRYFRQLRRSAEMLREYEQRWHYALESGGYGVWDWNVETGEVFYSNQWKTMLGLAEDEVRNTVSEWESRVHPEDLERVRAEMTRHLAGETPEYRAEHRLRRKDGSYRWVLGRGQVLSRSSDGKPLRVLGTQSDVTERKRSEAALRQWADAFEHCAHGIAIGLPDSNIILACNPALARMLGRSVAQLTGSPILSLFAPGDHAQVRAWILEADRTGQVRYESNMLREDSSLLPVQMDVVSVRDENGKTLYRVATAQDIAERKAAERVLQQRIRLQDQLAKIVQTAPGMICSFRLHPDGRTSMPFTTGVIEQLYGVTPDAVRDDFSPVFERVHPDDMANLKATVARSAETLMPWRCVYRVRHPQRGELWLEGHSMPSREPDGAVLWQGFVQDITERRRAEEALRLSEERYRGLVETSFDWVWEVDAEGRYTYVSPKVKDILGYTPGEVMGRTPFELMPSPEAERIRAFFREMAARRQAFSNLENTNRHKDGHLVILESSAVPVFGANGELIGYRGMDRDITERKRLEAQLRQAQKLEGIGQLAGGVAHDFNNILAAIMMNLGLLEMNPHLDPETRSILKDLHDEAQRAARLTRQLLMFSRRSVLTVKPVNLNEVISNLLKMLRRLIGEHIELQFQAGQNLSPVQADIGMLEQALMNLVVNARDAMPKGGVVRISTQSAQTKRESPTEPSQDEQGQFVCLTVADTGTGIHPADMKRIFEPFFTTKEVGKGTGLGLATVHGIVAQHHGYIEVDSEVGTGATFRVFLPIATQRPVPEAPAEGARRARGGTETLLLVEDELKVRRLAAQSLRTLGYRVYEAANGVEALQVFETHQAEIDLLLTDIVMPEGVSGLELAERLQDVKPALKVILSSGYSAEVVDNNPQTQARTLFLPKPYEINTLAERVRDCLDRREEPRQPVGGNL